MSELTDDQLDGLFRKSAEEFDPPFDPAAWQDMKTLLDANDQPVPGGTPLWETILQWSLVIGLFLLLLIGSLVSYFDVMEGSTASLPATSRTQIPPGNQATDPTEAALPKTTGTSLEKTRNNAFTDVSPQSADRGGGSWSAVSETSVNAPVAPEERSSGKKEGNTKPLAIRDATNNGKVAYDLKTDRVNIKPTAPDLNRTIAPTRPLAGAVETTVRKRYVGNAGIKRFLTGRQAGTRSRTGHTNGGISYPAMTVGALSGERLPRRTSAFVSLTTAGVESTNQPNGVQEEAAGLSAIHELAIRPAQWPKALPFRGRDWAEPVQPDTVAQQVTPAIPVQRGLSIRFTVAPDLSSVGLKNFSRPGTNVGVLLEYRIASRWSVQAGLLQSTKLYRASGTEYSTPSGWWQSPMKLPTWVDGRCNMFDIPVNIRYDVLVKPRQDGSQPNRWFVSGGVTSYIMKEEEYYYTYPPHTYNQPAEYTVQSGGYGFSNLNLSAGFERAITKRLSWQVEPFMKVPLKGVGFFRIDLLSTGTFFSVRYKL